MRPPTLGPSIAAAVAALALSAPRAEARPADPAPQVAGDRRDHDREQLKLIREAVRGWTWAAMPPVGADLAGKHLYDDDPRTPLVRVTALAADPSGGAFVAGAVRGPVRLGATPVGVTDRQRGFIAHVDRDGGFRLIQLGERQPYTLPSALAVDRAGRIAVSYEDGELELMTRQGRHVWSRELPPVRAFAFAPNGDILAAGGGRLETYIPRPIAPETLRALEKGNGYLARISPTGEIRWTYGFQRALDNLLPRRKKETLDLDCATGIAPGPDGDIYVAVQFAHRPFECCERDASRISHGSFIARFSGEGRLAWARPIARSGGPVALAASPDGSIAVVAGHVVTRDDPGELGPGLAAFDAGGAPVWSLPILATTRLADYTGTDHLQVAARGGGKAEFVLGGSHRAPIVVGGASLALEEGTVFLASVDRRGTVTSLHGLPGLGSDRRLQVGASPEGVQLAVSPAELWMAGTARMQTKGAWVHAVPW